MALSRLGAAAAAALLAGCGAPALVLPHAHAPVHAATPALRRAPVYLYPAAATAAGSACPPRAFVFFFGNDVGFWRAHERLAELLSAHGYAVAGFDVRRAFGHLPTGPARAAAFLAEVDSLVAASRDALGAANVPLVVAGHSIGGGLAVWTAVRLAAPGLAGVVTMSPGARGHLRTGLSDMLGQEPHGADSFAVDSEVARLAPRVRVALVRGTRDPFRYADGQLVDVGARRFVVPGQGHSLLNLRAAGPVVLAAVAYVLDGERADPAISSGPGSP
ncbi:MAG TPA: alpha/beta hydrolase [Gemmatirosa sp.]